jgi:predicted transport protein
MTLINNVSMPIFNNNKGKLELISETPFILEKDVQKLVEENMKTIFGVEFIASEFILNDLRVDSLGYNKESKSFVIIEYKREKNFSVIDQGYAYLALLLNNKADFILMYNEKTSGLLRKDDVDWSQSRVIFIAPFYTTYQRKAIEFKDLPIELWEIKKYSNNVVLLNQIQQPETSESITKISQSSNLVKSVSKEIVTYSEDYHLERCNDRTKDIYKELKELILSLSPIITVKVRKVYIAFANNDRNFVYLSTKRSGLELHLALKKGEITDPKQIAIDVSNKAHFQGVTQYLLNVDNKSDLGYVLTLIKQAFDKS